MDIQLFTLGLACLIIALIICLLLLHYVPFYAPSYFFWLGLTFGAIGLVSFIQPLIFLFVFNRTVAAVVSVSGLLISIISLFWPVIVHQAQSHFKIDTLLPNYSFNEFHEVRIKSTPEKVKHTFRITGVKDISLVNFLMKIRGFTDDKNIKDRVAINQVASGAFSTPDFNFFMFDSEEYISVMIIKASMKTSRSAKIFNIPEIAKLDDFLSFSTPGYVKVVINFRFVSINKEETQLTTETRIQGITPNDSRIFGIYWRIIYPGSAIIRRLWLDTIRKKTISPLST